MLNGIPHARPYRAPAPGARRPLVPGFVLP
jgi:hypothetical protein